ncbi:hypothetical protein HYZ78_00375 [Candidatus Microgenomates bacterium]|nr:hypothetical protein [Candidatus Microgenomates bacterium]
MGVIKPSWISYEWFQQCPFNYCDHFGNQKLLAKMCKICKQEIERNEKYLKEGRNPNSWENVFEEVGKSLALTMAMIQKDAKRLGIDLDAQIKDYKEPPPTKRYKIYNIIEKYGNRVERAIKQLEYVPLNVDIGLLKQIIDALSHSRFYILAKIARALHSRFEEKHDQYDAELQDSKTSALLAYVAIERNSRAFDALTNNKPLSVWRQKHIWMRNLSLGMCELIKTEFFPREKLVYEEFGCEDFGRELTAGD